MTKPCAGGNAEAVNSANAKKEKKNILQAKEENSSRGGEI